MKRRLDKRKFIYGMASVLGFVILYAMTFRSGEEIRWQQVEMVTFGDSVFTDLGGLTPVPDMLSEYLDISVYNAAMGGTCAARLEREKQRLDYAGGSLSLVGLTRAVLAEDFSVQQSARIRDSNQENFPEIIDGLAAIDFDYVNIVLIQKGVNDYHAGTRIENPDNPYDEYTFLGALRGAVRDLRRVDPEMRILMITPTYTWYTYTGQTCEEIDYGGGVLEDYVEAQLRLAQELDVEAVDLYHDFFPHESMEDWERYTLDGLHPNEAGREKIVQAIADVLQSGQED